MGNFRREPLETYIEREEYFRDFPSNYYGVYFDHHHFAHRLAVRRANKWHYTNDDLEHAHHQAAALRSSAVDGWRAWRSRNEGRQPCSELSSAGNFCSLLGSAIPAFVESCANASTFGLGGSARPDAGPAALRSQLCSGSLERQSSESFVSLSCGGFRFI